MGKFGLGSLNSYGEILFGFSESNKLSIINAFFRKRRNMKRTSKDPNRETRNEIDLFLLAHYAWHMKLR